VPQPPEFRPFVFQGRRFRLSEDPTVRARDVERYEVSLVSEDSGAIEVIHAAEQEMPPLPGIPPPGPLYHPRLFLEQILRLGFDDRWLGLIVDWASRHRLLMHPGKRPS
jgi:hypothetical protein